ncbi:MAG: rhodanese-like domain-containing protein [Gemmatimonadota bacterium]|nr:rhodanese-like domain-containing protein [Gemmatimonadota bacterium]
MNARRALAIAAAILAVLAAVSGTSRRAGARVDVTRLASEIQHEDDHVTAIELAQWIKDRKPGLRVLDVRSDSEFTDFHIPTAQRFPLESLTTLTPASDETLVLYSEGGAHAAQAWVLLRALGHDHVYFLRGGLLDWMDDVINPTLPSIPDSASTRAAALSRYFGGSPHVRFSTDSSAKPTSTSPIKPASNATTAAEAVARLRRRGC